jgi:hypothetical protein
MKKILIILTSSLFIFNHLSAQCRLIPTRENSKTIVKETYREPAFQMSTKDGTVTLAISGGNLYDKSQDSHTLFLGVTVVTPASLSFTMKSLSLASAAQESESDLLIFTDIEGGPGTQIIGDSGNKFILSKYTVYVNELDALNLMKMDLAVIGIMDRYDKKKIYMARSNSKDFVKMLMACVLKD